VCLRSAPSLPMLNYTERVTALMHDIVRRVPRLAFIDLDEVLVFARFGRTAADGAYATCHCLTLPTSEPGYYYWRDRRSGEVTRRSPWFVTRTPDVTVGGRRIKYLVSFALPRFCDQALSRSRKRTLYRGAEDWIAKLDTVVHELYHIDPDDVGIRKVARADGARSLWSHGPEFYEEVAAMVRQYLATNPSPATYDFLRHDFAGLQSRHGGVSAATFRNYPSYPQRYVEALAEQPDDPPVSAPLAPLPRQYQPRRYADGDLMVREFSTLAARRLRGVSGASASFSSPVTGLAYPAAAPIV
jgi:hypothetical protein